MSQPISNPTEVNTLLLPAIIAAKQQQGFGAAGRGNRRGAQVSDQEFPEQDILEPEVDRFEASETTAEDALQNSGYAEVFDQFQRDRSREEQQRRFEDLAREQLSQNRFEPVDRDFALNLARAVTGVYDFNSQAVFQPPNPGGNLNVRA